MRLPKRYEVRLLVDGRPWSFRGYGFSKDEGYVDAMKQARESLTADQIKHATNYGAERVS